MSSKPVTARPVPPKREIELKECVVVAVPEGAALKVAIKKVNF